MWIDLIISFFSEDSSSIVKFRLFIGEYGGADMKLGNKSMEFVRIAIKFLQARKFLLLELIISYCIGNN